MTDNYTPFVTLDDNETQRKLHQYHNQRYTIPNDKPVGTLYMVTQKSHFYQLTDGLTRWPAVNHTTRRAYSKHAPTDAALAQSIVDRRTSTSLGQTQNTITQYTNAKEVHEKHWNTYIAATLGRHTKFI